MKCQIHVSGKFSLASEAVVLTFFQVKSGSLTAETLQFLGAAEELRVQLPQKQARLEKVVSKFVQMEFCGYIFFRFGLIAAFFLRVPLFVC